MSAPPFEIIELALSKEKSRIIENLNAILGVRDSVLAGGWLLSDLCKSLPESAEKLDFALRCALNIASMASLGDEAYYEFDQLADELFLARHNTYGSVTECRDAMIEVLKKYPEMPFPAPTIFT
jgi:hypothetical protein